MQFDSPELRWLSWVILSAADASAKSISSSTAPGFEGILVSSQTVQFAYSARGSSDPRRLSENVG